MPDHTKSPKIKWPGTYVPWYQIHGEHWREHACWYLGFKGYDYNESETASWESK